MSEFNALEINSWTVTGLKQWLQRQENVFPFDSDGNSSLLVCYLISNEVGGPNDQLARFIFDDEQKKRVDPSDLEAQVGTFDGQFCIRIFSRKSSLLSLRLSHFREIIVCRGTDLLIFPSAIASRIRTLGFTPVIVRDWFERVAFSEFEVKSMSYRDQLWVLRNNEVMLYADLVAKRKVIFQEMHDIVAHIAGMDSEGYEFASRIAEQIYEKLRTYFGPRGRGNLPSHLIPFLIGLILDGLTQRPLYGSESRAMAIDELLKSIDELGIDPHSKLQLNGYPKGIDSINNLFRERSAFSTNSLRTEINGLIQECRDLTSEVFSTSALGGK